MEGDLEQVHPQHQLFTGEAQLSGWFMLMNGLFLFLSQQLGLGSPIELLGCAAVRELTLDTVRFSERDLFFLRDYDSRAGLEPVSSAIYLSIPPTRLIALTHPKLFVLLITQLNPDVISQLKFYTRYALYDGSIPPEGYSILKRGIIDAHFHMDKLSDFRCISLSDLEGSRPIPIRLPFAIANYVYPSRWNLIGDRVRMDPRLKITLGVHPHLITNDDCDTLYGRLERLLQKHPEAVGIGEVGIDHTSKCYHNRCRTRQACSDEKIMAQRRFLSLALQLAKRENKPVVLHVRDEGTGLAAAQVLNLLENLDMTNHPIHRHCFTGDVAEYRTWTNTLPNCYFSIAPKSIRDHRTMHALGTFDNRNRLLLETDADYFAGFPFPWSVNKVAEAAAQSLNMTMTDLIRGCNSNAARLYQLPW
ncbi:MAG: TatD family hydrolase [Candidatus Thiodiazotropha taylori]|nr:TatD family hydrolase [Candidatus Thiodiazotropha taylori]MCG8048703.1 TatD family hydrolase [Candidatus Thiodiazotropha taylori]MCW4336873.1 TatD family hydrolase [Candidatus Thiodiazotropha endolucinida]MCW4346458.1 TatD family hydrolase [Candidatus Thiodiazotropha endolucinida]